MRPAPMCSASCSCAAAREHPFRRPARHFSICSSVQENMRLRHLWIVAAAVTGATGTAMAAAQFAEGHGRFLDALVSRPYSTAGGAIGGALCGVLAWVLLRHRDNA